MYKNVNCFEVVELSIANCAHDLRPCTQERSWERVTFATERETLRSAANAARLEGEAAVAALRELREESAVALRQLREELAMAAAGAMAEAAMAELAAMAAAADTAAAAQAAQRAAEESLMELKVGWCKLKPVMTAHRASS
jgi:hypothetical protein